jgi:hypothetical protein
MPAQQLAGSLCIYFLYDYVSLAEVRLSADADQTKKHYGSFSVLCLSMVLAVVKVPTALSVR